MANLLTLLFLAYSFQGMSQANRPPALQIHFEQGSWATILKKAVATHSYIFVDAYASWCGPCKELKATTFKDKKAAVYFNSHFINFSIDTEKGEGVGLTETWGLESYPTLYIFDSQGKQLAVSEGFLDAAALIKFGESVSHL
jgi:thioredoxin 1